MKKEGGSQGKDEGKGGGQVHSKRTWLIGERFLSGEAAANSAMGLGENGRNRRGGREVKLKGGNCLGTTRRGEKVRGDGITPIGCGENLATEGGKKKMNRRSPIRMRFTY